MRLGCGNLKLLLRPRMVFQPLHRQGEGPQLRGGEHIALHHDVPARLPRAFHGLGELLQRVAVLGIGRRRSGGLVVAACLGRRRNSGGLVAAASPLFSLRGRVEFDGVQVETTLSTRLLRAGRAVPDNVAARCRAAAAAGGGRQLAHIDGHRHIIAPGVDDVDFHAVRGIFKGVEFHAVHGIFEGLEFEIHGEGTTRVAKEGVEVGGAPRVGEEEERLVGVGGAILEEKLQVVEGATLGEAQSLIVEEGVISDGGGAEAVGGHGQSSSC
mmetsp:Transcript_22126/g.47538  ORF Transcript_22126/g.47538 Transcript_22126/m.47538 type:complete len:269 (-) Transcript_22126:41-847(-)